MSKTKIEWADYTINPIVGCTKISEGCRFCYAEKMAWRLKCMGVPKYQDVVDQYGWTGRIGVDPLAFKKLPKKPKRVFVCSMGDLFYYPDDIIFQAIDAMGNSAFLEHTWLLLTKRPDKMADIIAKINPKYGLPSNFWLGVTVEHSDYLYRIEELFKIPAAVRFVSVEPCLDYVDLAVTTYWDDPSAGISWVIAGPETGPGARPCPEGAIENLYEQCRESGIKFFDKRPNFLEREFPK